MAAPERTSSVIVDEASLAGTFALDELVTAAGDAGAKVLLVGDHAQLSAVDAGGMFAALVRDRGGLAPRADRRAPVPSRLGEERPASNCGRGPRTPSTPMRPMAGSSRATGTRCSTPSMRAWKADTERGQDEPDDRRRPRHRERAQRPGPGRPGRRRAGCTRRAWRWPGAGRPGSGTRW